jgi:hypothetical protein
MPPKVGAENDPKNGANGWVEMPPKCPQKTRGTKGKMPPKVGAKNAPKNEANGRVEMPQKTTEVDES